MEESEKQIQILSYISTDLLLNVENRPFSRPSYAYRSYFNTVEKFREKERELSDSKKTKHTFVDKFYEKLKQQLQNNSDSKKLKENLSLMNICLKHKHARNASDNLNDTKNLKRQYFSSRLRKTAEQSKRQIPRQQAINQSAFQMKTRRIINSCKKQNQELNWVHKKFDLFSYYTKKMEQKFDESERKIKKTVREF